MKNKETRLNTIRRRSGKAEYGPITIFWSDVETETAMVDGEEITQAEFKRRYPDAKVIEWPENDDERGNYRAKMT